MTAPKTAPTQTYILVKGEHHIAQDDGTNTVAKIGDRVELTDTQFKSFGDKFRSEKEHNFELKRSARVAAAIRQAELEDEQERLDEQKALAAETADAEGSEDPVVEPKVVTGTVKPVTAAQVNTGALKPTAAVTAKPVIKA